VAARVPLRETDSRGIAVVAIASFGSLIHATAGMAVPLGGRTAEMLRMCGIDLVQPARLLRTNDLDSRLMNIGRHAEPARMAPEAPVEGRSVLECADLTF
jgi:hypothetical protein